ncbi:MAG: hypothetical protein LBP61_01325, partial [Desulfovibrio sp.]|nr:hypothetical protein [Desulfovibrio sp.]
MKRSDPDFSPASGKIFGLAPWLIIGLAVILGLAVAALALRNTQREEEYMTQNLLDRAESLIWGLEAGSRTRLGTRPEEKRILQSLVEETARQPGILFVAVADPGGVILAHSDPALVGSRMENGPLPAGPPAAWLSWRIREHGGDTIFEVYRLFSPPGAPHHGQAGDYRKIRPTHRDRRGWHGMWGGGGYWGRETAAPGPEAGGRTVYIGFDRQPFAEALAEDSRNSFLSAALVAALALAGFVSLFWAHSYRNSRRLFKDLRAFSSEVVSSLPLGLIASDARGNIVTANAPALDMLQAGGGNLQRLKDIPGMDWAGITALLAEKKKVLDLDTVLAQPSGRQLPISLSAAEMRNEDGLFLGRLFILRDMAEMKRLQAEARRNDRLAALGNLAAGVAHEIRNPLSTIKVLATYLAKTLRPGDGEEAAARTMITEIDRLNRVVSELLDFARPGAIKATPCAADEIISRALRLADADLKAKNIRVEYSRDPALPLAPLHPERFLQALLNLILNAVQAMDQNGVLRISTSLRP